MKTVEHEHTYFFVDESGDPIFYDRYGRPIVGTEGCSRVFLLGFIRTENPHALREAVTKLREEVRGDTYLQGIPSLTKSLIAFHAKNDTPEIRERMFKLIRGLDFKAEFIVARKIEKIFRSKYKSKQNLFYDDLVSKLFENKLHTSLRNTIYFATRGSKTRQEPLTIAIQRTALNFKKRWQHDAATRFDIFPQSPVGEPCLQIADYMNWAVQRAFERREDRYLNFLSDKISFLVDVYDFSHYPNNYYNRKNQFSINKISPL